jgi:methyltransferase
MVTLLGAMTAERIFELWLSRRNARRHPNAIESGARHTRVMAVFHAAVLIACAIEGSRRRHRRSPVAAGALVASQGLRYWAVATLGDRWNIRVLTIPGAQPVAGGPYRFIRHPNYLAVILEMTALPLACGAPWTALFATLGNAVLLWGRIRIEERALGASYARALGDRPRFLWRPNVGSRDSRRNPAHRA